MRYFSTTPFPDENTINHRRRRAQGFASRSQGISFSAVSFQKVTIVSLFWYTYGGGEGHSLEHSFSCLFASNMIFAVGVHALSS